MTFEGRSMRRIVTGCLAAALSLQLTFADENDGNGNGHGNGGNKNCPKGLNCKKERYLPHPQAASYAGRYFDSVFASILHNPNPTALQAAQGRGLDYDDGIYFAATAVFTADFAYQETPQLIRTDMYYLAGLWNSQTFFVRDVSPMLYMPQVHFPFATSPMLSTLNTTRNRNIALGFAAVRLSEYLVPTSTSIANLLSFYGMDTSYRGASDLTDARDIGNIAAAATIAYAKQDGWNQEGNDYPIWKHPFSDYLRWMPTNDAFELKNIAQWQPLIETKDDGVFYVQQHVTPQVAAVKTFALTQEDLDGRYTMNDSLRWLKHAGSDSDPLTREELQLLKKESDIVLEASANLNEDKKMIAQFFDSKLVSFGFMAFNSYMDPTYTTMKSLSLGLGKLISVHEATIVAWKEKLRLNGVRPVNSIRYLYGNTQVTAYAGPYQGTKTISGSDWNSYLRTMAHTDIPSATTCMCVAFAEFGERFKNTPGVLNLRWDFPPGSSTREPGVVPSDWLVKTWSTTEEFLRDCPYSRVDAGVHYNITVANTIEFCTGIGAKVWEKYYPKVKAIL
jgi:hypothetical protein